MDCIQVGTKDLVVTKDSASACLVRRREIASKMVRGAFGVRFSVVIFCFLFVMQCDCESSEPEKLAENSISAPDAVLVTMATDLQASGYQRLMRSADKYNITSREVLGAGQVWDRGGHNGLGLGSKVILLNEYLEPFKDDDQKIILFVDSTDVMLMAGLDEIVARFLEFDARVVFSSESVCWPDGTLADNYPKPESGYAYLNSGGIIGYASDLYRLSTSPKISARNDDQLFYTRIFVDVAQREKFGIKLDNKAVIFQSLYGVTGDLALVFELETNKPHLVNVKYKSRPLVIHGNGPSKHMLDKLTVYLEGGWKPLDGCNKC